MGNKQMDSQRRKALLAQYKEMKTYMGVIQITNRTNGKVFVAGFPNLKNKWMTIKAQLDAGRYANLELQRDWHALGEGAFSYEVLEEKATTPEMDVKWEVQRMTNAWLDKIEPHMARGYNKPR